MKKGEQEARSILEKYGIEFDYSHSDNNIGRSRPDLKYIDGGYLEVTHTRHNNAIYSEVRGYYKKPIDEQLRISLMASEALTRVHNGDYERKDYKITEEGLKQYRKDCKLLKKHLGYDPTSFDNSTSEFKCDIPTIELSADNVIREISRDKGKKYPEGNVDLFIFVTEEEYEYFFRIFSELKWNGCANNHFKLLINSPFKVIYVCVWDIVHQRYEVDNPCIRKLEKTMDGGIQITSLGIG